MKRTIPTSTKQIRQSLNGLGIIFVKEGPQYLMINIKGLIFATNEKGVNRLFIDQWVDLAKHVATLEPSGN